MFGLFGKPDIDRLKSKGDLKGLTRALRNKNLVSVRRSAAEALGDIGDASVIDQLVGCWADLQPDAGMAIGRIIERTKASGDFSQLVPLLQSDNPPQVRYSAALALGGCRDPAAVAHLLKNGWSLGPFGTWAVAQIGDLAVDRIVTLLKEKPRSYWAMDTLAEIASPLAWDVLVSMISASGSTDRYGPARRLARSCVAAGEPDPLVRALAGHGDTVAHAVLIDGISEIGSSAVGPVMRGVRQAHTGQWIEPTGLFTRALASLGSDAIDALIEDIDPKGEYQHVRITILGQIGDERAVEPLRRFLHGTDRPWLMSAVEALGNIGHRSAADDLLAIAEYALDAERPRLRSVYFKALGQVGDQRAIPILLNALPTADAQVEATIAVSLGRIGGEEALDALRTGLARADEDLREAYVEALSVIEDSRAAELLTGAMADQNDRVRLFAAEGLGKLRDAAYLDVLGDALHDSSWRVRVAAAEAIGGLGDRTATAPLLSALRDALTKWDGRAAADALIDLWGPNGQPILDAICSEDDTSQLIWALCSVNALEPLHTALAEGADPTTAAEALKKLGDPRSVDPLLRALADEDADLRADAASALGAIGDPKALIGLSALLLDSEVEVVHAAFRAIQAIAGDEAVRRLIPHLCDRESIRTGAVFEGHIPESTAAASISEVHTDVDAKSLPSRSDYWRCPHCDAVLRKGPARLAKIVVGVGTCANCRSEFSQADIYGGTYDVSVAFDVKSGGVSATTADPPHSSNKNFIEACGSGDAAKVRELLGEGLSADGIDPQWTPLMSAASNGHREVVELLLEGGATPDVPGAYGPAINLAARYGHVPTVRALLDRGADPTLPDFRGTSTLMHLSCLNDLDLIVDLIGTGVDVNLRNDGGGTALYVAAAEGHIAIARALVQAGAQVDVPPTEYSGETPISIAQKHGHADLAQYLSEQPSHG